MILAFFAFQSLPINIAGVLLIALAIILFLLEIKVTSYGILAIGGTISLLLGSVMLIDTTVPELRISWGVILPGAILTAGFFFFAILLSAKAQKSQPTTGKEGMIGEVGEVIQTLSPQGRIKVHGEIWTARTLTGEIPVGAKAIVKKVDKMLLIVESYTEQ